MLLPICLGCCNTSVEEDAEAAASIACKIQQLIRTQRFEDSLDDRVQLEKKQKEIEAKCKRKYQTGKEKQLFIKYYHQALGKCTVLSAGS